MSTKIPFRQPQQHQQQQQCENVGFLFILGQISKSLKRPDDSRRQSGRGINKEVQGQVPIRADFGCRQRRPLGRLPSAVNYANGSFFQNNIIEEHERCKTAQFNESEPAQRTQHARLLSVLLWRINARTGSTDKEAEATKCCLKLRKAGLIGVLDITLN